ncbi:MAG: hypothetical protein KDG52_06035 [Rhodocyclaceae bacterium]|nr:hypothetical protein [Rhodocyclaceae bacterium]
MKLRSMARIALLATTAALAAPLVADDEMPPLPLYMLEQRGTLTRIDVARRMVWIDRKPYKVTDETHAYIGARRLDDLRKLPRGGSVAYMPGTGGALTSLWAEQAAPESPGRRRK